jgi:hypothetical protein
MMFRHFFNLSIPTLKSVYFGYPMSIFHFFFLKKKKFNPPLKFFIKPDQNF